MPEIALVFLCLGWAAMFAAAGGLVGLALSRIASPASTAARPVMEPKRKPTAPPSLKRAS